MFTLRLPSTSSRPAGDVARLEAEGKMEAVKHRSFATRGGLGSGKAERVASATSYRHVHGSNCLKVILG